MRVREHLLGEIGHLLPNVNGHVWPKPTVRDQHLPQLMRGDSLVVLNALLYMLQRVLFRRVVLELLRIICGNPLHAAQHQPLPDAARETRLPKPHLINHTGSVMRDHLRCKRCGPLAMF